MRPHDPVLIVGKKNKGNPQPKSRKSWRRKKTRILSFFFAGGDET